MKVKMDSTYVGTKNFSDHLCPSVTAATLAPPPTSRRLAGHDGEENEEATSAAEGGQLAAALG
jgi:hypothetical protein